MRYLLFLFVVSISVEAHSMCGWDRANFENENLYIYISDDEGDCDKEPEIIRFAFIKNGTREEIIEVPFLSECENTVDGFKCRSGGRTPLAGTTYKHVAFGRSANNCRSSEDLGQKYICVSGCERPDIPESKQPPEYLNGDDGSC